MTNEELKAIEDRREAALQEVYALCLGRGREGGKDWTMCIPPDQRRDSDFVLTNSLHDIPSLIARVKELEEQLEEANEHGTD